MYNILENDKLLIVFSDPGGAKPCLALVSQLKNSEILIVSDRSYNFYKDFGLDVKILKSLAGLDGIIDSFNPTLILTGTSYTSDIEKRTVVKAKQRGIKSISFIDHFTSMLDRFKDDSGIVTFPDAVYVVDEKAKRLAAKEGIPAELLDILPNPYHSWIKNWRPNRTRNSFYEKLGIEKEKKVILFAPDPLSNINGIEGYGYDEVQALIKLLNIINGNVLLYNRFHFLLKPHPNQVLDKLEKVLEGQAYFNILPKEIDTNECIFFSDCVMGFFSSILLEADLLSKPIVRFIPKNSLKDPFRSLNLGIVVDEENLAEEILKRMN